MNCNSISGTVGKLHSFSIHSETGEIDFLILISYPRGGIQNDMISGAYRFLTCSFKFNNDTRQAIASQQDSKNSLSPVKKHY